MADRLVIATRESRLALWQAEHVRALLEHRLGMTVTLLPMTTRGGQILDRSLRQPEPVRALLDHRPGMTVTPLPMTTRGDQILDRSLAKVGCKGLFIKELE